MVNLETIGFVGLGTMGQAMAGNLLKAGFAVQGYDLSAAAIEAFRQAGGRAAASPRDAAEGADLVIAMLPNAPDVQAVMTGAAGILAAEVSGRLLMNMSTVDPAAAQHLAALAAEAGWRYLDAPVGRTAAHAAVGESLFMLGGEAEDKAAVRPALEAMGNAIVDCGAVGQASTIKIANNYLSIVAAVTTSEALRLAEAGGVEPEALLRVVNGTTAMNGHTKSYFPSKVLAGDVSAGFSVDNAHKDLTIAVAAMRREGIPCFTGPGSLEAYETARQQGRGANDWSDLFNLVGELWRKESG